MLVTSKGKPKMHVINVLSPREVSALIETNKNTSIDIYTISLHNNALCLWHTR